MSKDNKRQFQCPKCFGLFDKYGIGPHLSRCSGLGTTSDLFGMTMLSGWIYWLTWGPLMLLWISFLVWVVTGWLRALYSQLVFSQAEWALKEVLRWAMEMFYGVNREFMTPRGNVITNGASQFNKTQQSGSGTSP